MLPSRGSLQSPLPLLLAGIAGALILIAVVTLLARQPSSADPFTTATLSAPEALATVAQQMRSGTASQQVMTQGQAVFDNGTWRVMVGAAQFHFTVRNRIVVPDNDAAAQLEFGG